MKKISIHRVTLETLELQNHYIVVEVELQICNYLHYLHLVYRMQKQLSMTKPIRKIS